MRNGYADPGDLVAYNRSGDVVMGVVVQVTKGGTTLIECIEEGWWKGKISRVRNPGSVRVILDRRHMIDCRVRDSNYRIAGLEHR